MTLTIAISLFFGLVAALSLASCHASLRSAWQSYRTIRAQLATMDRAPAKATVRLRQPREAFALAAAA